MAAPAVVGSNCTFSVTAWLGLSLTGKLPPETENPAPAIVAELTVTATVPVDVNVTDFVTAESTVTFPNDTLLVLTLSVDIAAFSCNAKPWELVPSVAVNVAACAVLTEATVAVKMVLLVPVGTLTEAGTVTDELLLERLTLTPPLGAAPLSVTVQVSVPDPVNDEPLQERAFSIGTVVVPVPVRLTTVEGLLDELLLIAS